MSFDASMARPEAPAGDATDAKAEYIRQRKEEIQDGIVNYRAATSLTSDAVIWTYRSTGCDIVSVVTTTTPIKNGAMRDVRLHNKEMRRIKPPVNRVPGKVNPGNPLAESEEPDVEKTRAKNSLVLRRERDAFMKKLETSRAARTAIERLAATAIQRIYRGRFTRERLPVLQSMCQRRRDAHKRACEGVAAAAAAAAAAAGGAGAAQSLVLTGMQHRQRYSLQRYRSAEIVQCCFRQYVSRRVFRNRIHERAHTSWRRAVVRLQCLARSTSAKARVRLLRQRAYLSRTRKSAVLIQKSYRALFARRLVRKRRVKLHWICARLIQGWYRSKKARVRSLKIKQILIERKLWLGAEGMQCLVRRKIARCRVNRVRLRRLYLYLFASATTIQGMIRKFLARVRVRSVRKGKAADAAIAVAAGERQREKDVALAELAEAKELLEGADIFAQARAGRAVDVEDIYTGRLSDEKHEPNEVDENSDTVLTIAAAKGFVDIVRKCFQWAFDFNHRNADGLTALMLAVQNNHLDVVQYILVPPVKYQLDRFTQEDSSFLLVHALESEALQRHRSSKYLYSLEMFKALMNQSLQLKEKDPISGTTPLHAACGLGDIETFRLCIKNRAVHDMVDDAGQLPLHRACTSSIEIAKMLLGIDASAGILLPDSKRAPILLTKDVDGKDCRLYAAIYGQSKILKFVTEVVAGNRDAHNASKKAPAEDVGWTPEDFSAILRLASGGNVPCFSYVAECGFDPTWGQQDTDVTVAMLAAERGQLAFLDFLLARKTDLTAKDKEGRTVMHYAAQCADEAVVAHLLSHADAAACGLSQMALAGQDVRGRTPLHVAAANNVAISVDLLAGDGLEAALRTQDKCGMSPLSVAAQRMHLNLAASYLQLEAPVALLDTSDHGVMWHLFHPNKLRAGGAKPIASELRAKLGLEAKLSKSAREANASLLAADIKLVVELARRGCPLYQSPKVTTEELLATPFETIRAAETPMTKELLGEYCPGDLLVQELCVGALGALVEVASLADCWRLLLSSIRYDDGTGKAFVALLEAGLADRLAGQSDASALRTEMTRHTVAQLSTGVYFGGLSVAGWCIRLGNAPLLQRLYKKGLDPSHAADVRGDSCLHVIARFGTPSMVDLTLSNESVVVEGVNAFGRTALMEAAKASNFSAAKRLVGCQASARRGLGGKYWGWLLALAHKQERVQINSQTGRIGDDDTTYFPAPEPSWYEEAMDSSIVSLQRK